MGYSLKGIELSIEGDTPPETTAPSLPKFDEDQIKRADEILNKKGGIKKNNRFLDAIPCHVVVAPYEKNKKISAKLYQVSVNRFVIEIKDAIKRLVREPAPGDGVVVLLSHNAACLCQSYEIRPGERHGDEDGTLFFRVKRIS